MSDKRKIVTNKDNELLHPWGNEMFTIGYVEQVNGPGAEEFPEFDPTRHELIQIVKYWTEEWLDLDYFMFLYNQTGSDWLRKSHFAHRRVGRIAEILGDDEVKKTIDEVYTQFGKTKDKRTWDIFLNGTEEQREEIQDEIQRELPK